MKAIYIFLVIYFLEKLAKHPHCPISDKDVVAFKCKLREDR